MTETEYAQILERFARIEAQVNQLKKDIEFGWLPIAASDPESVSGVHEPKETYTARPVISTTHPHIVRIPGVQGGEPIVHGAYKTVRGIVELTRRGLLPEQIVADHGPPLTLAHVYDALSYYYDNQEEMDQIIARHQAALEEIIHPDREQSGKRTTPGES